MVLSCKEASRLMSEGMDKEIAFGRRTALRLHLLICSGCSRVKSHFGFLRATAGRYPGPEQDDDVSHPRKETE